MMNPVLMLVYNTTAEQLALTKEAVASVLAQDIPVKLFLWDNGSTEPETKPWMESLRSARIQVFSTPDNRSPIHVGNRMLWQLFHDLEYPHILGVPNDVILPSNFYRECLRWPRGLVTASQTGERDFPVVTESRAVAEMTPMATAMIRRWFYDAIVAKDGYFFDEKFVHYASDCDLALRMAACGIRGVQLDMQYYHYGSASWRLAADGVGRAITDQADKDRDYFEQKWGFKVSDPKYGQSAVDINFRG